MRIFVIVLLIYSFFSTLLTVLLISKIKNLKGASSVAIPTVEMNEVFEIDIQDIPFTTAEVTPITIVGFTDFGCKACAKGSDNLRRLLCQFPGKIRVGYKIFPSLSNQQSVSAATAALAAYRQGHFWEMEEALFRNRDSLGGALYQKIAASLHLDMTAFNAEKEPELWLAYLKVQKGEAQMLGIEIVPTYFVNGIKVEGSNYQVLESTVRQVMKASGFEIDH